MLSHAEEIGSVAKKLAESCGGAKLVGETEVFYKDSLRGWRLRVQAVHVK